MKNTIALVIAILTFQNALVAKPARGVVVETATKLPLAYDVDVAVVGGSLAGVEAACAAADQGATVLLVDSRPYIGFDLCATQKLWLDQNETPATPLTKQLFGDKPIVTPMEVKRTLDDTLLEHNVQFLTGTFPAELLFADDGAPGGLTIVNRSGRQVVRARIIIDATPDAVLTRQSAAEFVPFRAGPKQCQFTVVGGELRDEADGKQLPGVFYQATVQAKKTKNKTARYPVFEYSMLLEHDSDTFRARSKALNRVRSKVYDSTMVDHSEHLLYFPDNLIVPAVSTEDYSPNDCPLGVFRPRGIDNLYVVNGYAGVAEPSARRSLIKSPCNVAKIGQRIGVDAGNRVKKRTTPQRLRYCGAATGNRDVSVSEVETSFRFRDCPQVELADHDLPVLGRWDVVVVGGGTSGAPAAIGAARRGARTLVIEYMDELGGVGTAGMISNYWYGLQSGFTAEIDKRVGIERNWWPIKKAEWLRTELMKNDAEVWFGSFGCGTVMKGNKVSGVVVATPFGRGVVLADVVVDSTGNSDIAASASADTRYSISALGDLTVQVAGYPDRSLGQRHNNTAYAMIDDTDVLDRMHFLLTARQHGGLRNQSPYDMGQLIDTRDRRRIVGDYTLTTRDILAKRAFPDTIAHHRSNFDAGALPSDEMFLIKDMKGPVYECDMPYRCLTPKGVEGLLVTGLSASAHRDAMTLTRMQPDLQNQGYAAGMAAALAARTTAGLVREIDVRTLQNALVSSGCLEERVLTDSDSFPMSEEALRQAVQTLHELTIDVHQKREYDDTLPALAVVMGHPEQSIPLLREAYRNAEKLDTKINFARILAVLGDATGKETLLQAVDDAKSWGEGWDFSSQREHANSFGEVDRMVIALGFLHTPEVLPPLTRKLEQLEADSPLSHFKAVCLASRLNKDRSLVQPLAKLLGKKGIKGHAQPLTYYTASGGAGGRLPERYKVNAQGGTSLNAKFKEVLVAALLFECGDHNGLGREILEAYTKDVNGHFAAYAYHVLSAGTAMKSEAAPTRPNVIVIMADDLGFSDLGCYGGEIQTPYIDRLAQDGIRFSGFKNTSRCAPSRASLLTGRYQHAVGVGWMTAVDEQRPGYRGQLSPSAPTLAEILKAHGYGTGVVGKWHLTLVEQSKTLERLFPLDRGFDFYHGTWWGAKDYFSPRYMMKNREHLAEGNYPKDYYLTEDLSESAIDFIESQSGKDRPFFLYLAHYAPHAPIQAPEARVQKCLNRYLAGFDQLQRERFARQQTLGVLPENTTIAAGMPSWDKLSDARKNAWARKMATYAAMIEIMDDGIGKLIEVLIESGQYENSLIFFLSDNGATPEGKGSTTYAMLSNTPYRGHKAHTWQGGISSPLIVSWPKELREHAGCVRHGTCHVIDILPSCLDAAGIKFPTSFRSRKPAPPDGTSLMNAVSGACVSQRSVMTRPLFWEHQGSRAVFQDGWKLIADGETARWELYNLADDPTEQTDLTERCPERVDALKTLWESWAQEKNVLPLQTGGVKERKERWDMKR